MQKINIKTNILVELIDKLETKSIFKDKNKDFHINRALKRYIEDEEDSVEIDAEYNEFLKLGEKSISLDEVFSDVE